MILRLLIRDQLLYPTNQKGNNTHKLIYFLKIQNFRERMVRRFCIPLNVKRLISNI